MPSDKSISHRAIILASLAKGKSTIKNFSLAADPHSSLEICKKLGIEAIFRNNAVFINSNGFNTPTIPLFCGNSGTTMRLMAGVLAGQSFNSVLTGDDSLSVRPMKRIIDPLSLMGANIDSDNFHAPLKIFGRHLCGIDYVSKIASAQVKSCILLAGLNAQGKTSFTEPYISRNHTEIMLRSMGAKININNNTVTIENSELEPLNVEICGDISSAAFFIVAGLIVPNAKIILRNVGLNPTRTGILEIINKMNGNLTILDEKEVCGELVGDIQVEYSEQLKSCEISGELIPKLIDEIPVIALLATQAEGQTIIKDAQDLRNKEADRISETVKELRKLGADITETSDGMIVRGKTPLIGGIDVDSHKDHRLAMTLYVAGLITKKEISIKDFDWVNISFPSFLKLFSKL